MTDMIVFNHHSLPFPSKDEADSAIPDFLKICIGLRNIGLNTICVDVSVDRNWFRLELASGFYWQDWYNKNKTEMESIDNIRAFREISTKQPLFSTDDFRAGCDLCDVIFNSNKYNALRAAAWHDTGVISFPTSELWGATPLHTKKQYFDGGSNLVEEDFEIDNIHSLDIFNTIKRRLEEARDTSIRSGRDIFERRSQLYPYLEFCDDAISQLKQWSLSYTILRQVVGSLLVLNDFAGRWNEGAYDAYSHANLRACGLNHEVSGESSSVLNNQSLRQEREFWLPRGEKVVFQNHIKFTQGYRMHFYPDDRDKKIYIAYIGKHLTLGN